MYFLDPGQGDQLPAALADASSLVEDALASGQLMLAEGKGSPGEMEDALATCLADFIDSQKAGLQVLEACRMRLLVCLHRYEAAMEVN